jgi:hypothetical protein
MRNFIPQLYHNDLEVAVETRSGVPLAKEKYVLWHALIPAFSPGEGTAQPGLGFAYDRPANPVARIFKETENDSPSPRGRRLG